MRQSIIEFLLSLPDQSLVLGGEIADVWENPWDMIYPAYYDLFQLLARKAYAWVQAITTAISSRKDSFWEYLWSISS